VNFRNAAILCLVLIGGMFAVSFAGPAVLRPYAESGAEIPSYVRGFIGVYLFCSSFKWIAAVTAFPIIGALFTFAALTTYGRARK